MILFLLLLGVWDRPYHAATIDQLQRSRMTHVQAEGRVTYIRLEADGDIHFRIADAHGHFLVCEIIPTLLATPPISTPEKGQTVIVRGIRRYDGQHRWTEIHPVEAIVVR